MNQMMKRPLNYWTEGKYDIMGGMFYQEEYEQYFNYPKYIMGSNYSLLMYQKDNSDIKGYDYNTLNGKRIGVFGKAASKIERLKKFIEYNNLTCELVYYDDRELYEKCIDSGDVDLIYGSDVYMKDGYNVAVKLDSDPYYLVTSKDKPELCEQLSKAMEEIYAANPNFAEELYNKYFPDKYINSITFTDEEDKFIKEYKYEDIQSVELLLKHRYENYGTPIARDWYVLDYRFEFKDGNHFYFYWPFTIDDDARFIGMILDEKVENVIDKNHVIDALKNGIHLNDYVKTTEN